MVVPVEGGIGHEEPEVLLKEPRAFCFPWRDFSLLSSISGAFLRTFTLRDPFLMAFDRLNLTTSVPVDAPETLLSGTCSASLS